MDKIYYEAYDDRYRQVHSQNLQWFSDAPSEIVAEVMERYGVDRDKQILELGCGEGRDALFLLERGFDVLATDISPEAIAHCRRNAPAHAASFRVLDCVKGSLDERFDFIYAVAVVHMLVRDEDREGFYRFIRAHLNSHGRALICTMGNGELERSSDIETAFSLQPRRHQQTGRELLLAGTSCRMVSFDTFTRELHKAGLQVLRQGLTAVEPDFPIMMYAVVQTM